MTADLFNPYAGYSARIGAVPEIQNVAALTGLTQATRAVHSLLSDGEWHSATAIIEASGIREGLRRMRELRQVGFKIERAVQDGALREFKYRITGTPA
jgi:hypothetical protein